MPLPPIGELVARGAVTGKLPIALPRAVLRTAALLSGSGRRPNTKTRHVPECGFGRRRRPRCGSDATVKRRGTESQARILGRRGDTRPRDDHWSPELVVY